VLADALAVFIFALADDYIINFAVLGQCEGDIFGLAFKMLPVVFDVMVEGGINHKVFACFGFTNGLLVLISIGGAKLNILSVVV